MWTTENTEGFTQSELDTMNTVLERVFADVEGYDQASIDSINDAITNAWADGITEAQLEASVRNRLGVFA